MYEIDRVAGRQAFLVTDLFSHTSGGRPDVFLCGAEPTSPFDDIRYQIKHLLETRMGCTAFLGEDIEDLKNGIHADKDHLSIEVTHAKRADLVIIFLNSPGTISELTAFALNDEINPKLLVLNSEEFKDKPSFINNGPMKLLRRQQIVHYAESDLAPSARLVQLLDLAIGEAWFNSSDDFPGGKENSLDFMTTVTLLVIRSCNPVNYRGIFRITGDKDKKMRTALASLIEKGLVDVADGLYRPTSRGVELYNRRQLEKRVARIRMRVFGEKESWLLPVPVGAG